MSNLILTLVIDCMMAVLLVVTLWYCWRLNKRIAVLQDAKSELAQIVREFDISTQRATQSIAEIHQATSRISENIQHKIDKANFLADDLQFLIERSAKVTGKPLEPATPPSAARPAARPAGARPAAEGVAEQAELRRKPGLRVRSKAEQELLDALKTND
jgi:hypothetical protein